MKKYYFTFGFGQPIKEVLDYVEIIADSSEKAREEMIRNFNTRWAMQYDEKQWKGQVEAYNYNKYITIKL